MTINGVVYDYPEPGDEDWGPEATDWAAAVSTGMLQKAGGLFQLLAEADFGTAFGVKSLYYKSRTANVASAGQIRLARADVIAFRDQANGADLNLGVSASDVLQFNGVDIQSAISVSDTSTIDLTLAGTSLSADIIALSITDSLISASAAIAFSKLAPLASGNLLVGSAGNVATSVAMSGDATIVASGALTIANNAVSNAKLAQMVQGTIKGRAASSGTGDPVDLTPTQATAILNNFVGDSGAGGTKGLVLAPAAGDAAAGKFLKADGNWTVPAGAGDVTGPASSTDEAIARFNGATGKVLQNSGVTIDDSNNVAGIADLTVTGTTTLDTSLDGVVKAVAGLISASLVVNADVDAAAAIAFSKLASLPSAQILVGSAGNVATAVAVTGDISITNGGVTAYAGTVPLNKGGTGQTTKAPAFDALSPMTTSGDIIYGGASGTGTRLAKGSDGNILTLVAGLPAWSPVVTWTGYHDEVVSNWNFTTTASFADPTSNSANGNDVVVVEDNGLGTVTSYASGARKLPGIVFTPPTAGRYRIHADVQLAFGLAGGAIGFQLYDGTTYGGSAAINGNIAVPFSLDAIFNLSNVSTTVRIVARLSGAASVPITSSGLGMPMIYWSIEKIG